MRACASCSRLQADYGALLLSSAMSTVAILQGHAAMTGYNIYIYSSCYKKLAVLMLIFSFLSTLLKYMVVDVLCSRQSVMISA